MEIELKVATIEDCKKIHSMQMVGFKALLDKYQDLKQTPVLKHLSASK